MGHKGNAAKPNVVLPPVERHDVGDHVELGQCRKCNYSLKSTQNFRLFIFVGQAEQQCLLRLSHIIP